MLEPQEIKALLDDADKRDTEASSVIRWQAAEAMVENLDAGITQVILADQLHRGQTLVSYCARVWRERESIPNESGTFQEAYRWVQENPVHRRRGRTNNPRNPRHTCQDPCQACEAESQNEDAPVNQFETDENGVRIQVRRQVEEAESVTQSGMLDLVSDAVALSKMSAVLDVAARVDRADEDLLWLQAWASEKLDSQPDKDDYSQMLDRRCADIINTAVAIQNRVRNGAPNWDDLLKE